MTTPIDTSDLQEQLRRLREEHPEAIAEAARRVYDDLQYQADRQRIEAEFRADMRRIAQRLARETPRTGMDAVRFCAWGLPTASQIYPNHEREENDEGRNANHGAEGRREANVGYRRTGDSRCGEAEVRGTAARRALGRSGREDVEGVRPECGEDRGDRADGGGIRDWSIVDLGGECVIQLRGTQGEIVAQYQVGNNHEPFWGDVVVLHGPQGYVIANWVRVQGSWTRRPVGIRIPIHAWHVQLSEHEWDSLLCIPWFEEIVQQGRCADWVFPFDGDDRIAPENLEQFVEESVQRFRNLSWDNCPFDFQIRGPCEPTDTKEANERAEALLLEHLDEEQAGQWKDINGFVVKAPSGREYSVFGGISQEVVRYGDSARFCIQPAVPVPVADACLARKLLIEADEELFLATANRLDAPWRRIDNEPAPVYYVGSRSPEPAYYQPERRIRTRNPNYVSTVEGAIEYLRERDGMVTFMQTEEDTNAWDRFQIDNIPVCRETFEMFQEAVGRLRYGT